MGICFAIGAAGLILYYIRFDMIKVVLRPDRGIEICRRSGNRFIAWDDIECMTSVVFQVQSRGMYAFTSEKHEVTLKDQSKVSLTSGIEDVFRIAQAIDVELMKRLYPEYLEKFQKGLPVSFGSLTLTSEGFSKGNSTLPWESVAFVGIDNGYLVVEARGKILSWYKKGCGKIPHVPILLRLVKTKVNF